MMENFDLLKWYKDFPKPGINFCDVWHLLENNSSVATFAGLIFEKWKREEYESDTYPITFAGVESRGFVIAGMLSAHTQRPFVPIRKAGKLPGAIVSQAINLEYGEAVLEMQLPAIKRKPLIIVDDVLATGGTLAGAKQLAEKAGWDVIGAAVLVNLLDVPKVTDNWLKNDVIALMNYYHPNKVMDGVSCFNEKEHPYSSHLRPVPDPLPKAEAKVRSSRSL